MNHIGGVHNLQAIQDLREDVVVLHAVDETLLGLGVPEANIIRRVPEVQVLLERLAFGRLYVTRL